MRILFLGDIVGRSGRNYIIENLTKLRKNLAIDVCIANAENASGGKGLSSRSAKTLLQSGVDVISSGNHIWKFLDIHPLLKKEPRLLCPANYEETFDLGYGLYHFGDIPYAVINLLGRTFLQNYVCCPFKVLDEILEKIQASTNIIFVDFHAEATSEKRALAEYAAGRISALVGTHTHVQTNDAQIIAAKTAFLTDAGMCGVKDSCLGVEAKAIIAHFKTGRPQHFKLAKGAVQLSGAIIDIDEETGHALSIEPWNFCPDEINLLS